MVAAPKDLTDATPNPPDRILRPTDPLATPLPASAATDRVAPPPAAAATDAAPPTIPVHSGTLGHDTGVAIARHVLAGGGEALTIRLDPKDFGRVEVNLSFDDAGTLRAVVAADVPASLDLLRRDAPELTRALSDAGLRADATTLRFDTRGDGGGQSGQRQPHPQSSRYPVAAPAEDATPDTPAWRPLATRGRIDLMA